MKMKIKRKIRNNKRIIKKFLETYEIKSKRE